MGEMISAGMVQLTPAHRRALEEGDLWLRVFTPEYPTGAPRARLVLR